MRLTGDLIRRDCPGLTYIKGVGLSTVCLLVSGSKAGYFQNKFCGKTTLAASRSFVILD